MPARRWCEFFVLLVGFLVFGYFLSSCSKPENKNAIVPTASAPAARPEFSPVPAIDPHADFSKFRHANAEHARFPCALCHERTDNSPTPKFSGHLPCAGCHTAQFADQKNAICTICHTNPETAALKPFPALASFNVVFDHAKHRPKTNCAACHQPARGGVGLSIPAGLGAHTACFACHGPGAESGGEKIDSCGVCHRNGKSVGVSERARTFETTPFRHAGHRRLDCAVCHVVRAGAARGGQVATALVAKMHFPPPNALSCASCHNNKRAFGGDDFQDCRRCHRGNGFKFS